MKFTRCTPTLALAMSVSLTLTLAVNASAQTEQYIIGDGPGAGKMLDVVVGTPNVVGGGMTGPTSGVIQSHGGLCPTAPITYNGVTVNTDAHFHGTLDGVADPNVMGCGHGRAAPVALFMGGMGGPPVNFDGPEGSADLILINIPIFGPTFVQGPGGGVPAPYSGGAPPPPDPNDPLFDQALTDGDLDGYLLVGSTWDLAGEPYLPPGGEGSGLPEDIDGDGVVTPADAYNVINRMGSNNPSADVNGDGVVDQFDVNRVTDKLGEVGTPTSKPLPGDFNNDGQVDGSDYGRWSNAVGSNDPACDADGNGTVDEGDFSIWRDNFGSTSGPAAPGGLGGNDFGCGTEVVCDPTDGTGYTFYGRYAIGQPGDAPPTGGGIWDDFAPGTPTDPQGNVVTIVVIVPGATPPLVGGTWDELPPITPANPTAQPPDVLPGWTADQIVDVVSGGSGNSNGNGDPPSVEDLKQAVDKALPGTGAGDLLGQFISNAPPGGNGGLNNLPDAGKELLGNAIQASEEQRVQQERQQLNQDSAPIRGVIDQLGEEAGLTPEATEGVKQLIDEFTKIDNYASQARSQGNADKVTDAKAQGDTGSKPSATTEKRGGAEVTTHTPEAVTIRNADGSMYERLPDGTVRTTHADGSSVTTRPNGAKTIVSVSNGKTTRTTIWPDGKMQSTLHPNGNVTVRRTNPDGSRWSQTITPDGQVTNFGNVPPGVE